MKRFKIKQFEGKALKGKFLGIFISKLLFIFINTNSSKPQQTSNQFYFKILYANHESSKQWSMIFGSESNLHKTSKIIKLCLLFTLLLQSTEQNVTETRKELKITLIYHTSSRQRFSAPVIYYSDHVSCFKLLLSGDIEVNPGPVLCSSCKKNRVRSNSKRFECTNCKEQLHLKCSKDPTVKPENGRRPVMWTC